MSDTPKLMASALRVLAGDIQAPDDVPALCLRDAASMIEKMEQQLAAERARIAKLENEIIAMGPTPAMGVMNNYAAQRAKEIIHDRELLYVEDLRNRNKELVEIRVDLDRQIRTYSAELAAERAAHEATKARIAELEAQLRIANQHLSQSVEDCEHHRLTEALKARIEELEAADAFSADELNAERAAHLATQRALVDAVPWQGMDHAQEVLLKHEQVIAAARAARWMADHIPDATKMVQPAQKPRTCGECADFVACRGKALWHPDSPQVYRDDNACENFQPRAAIDAARKEDAK